MLLAITWQVKELEGPAEDMVHPRVREEMRRRASPLLGISLIPRLPPGQVGRCQLLQYGLQC